MKIPLDFSLRILYYIIVVRRKSKIKMLITNISRRGSAWLERCVRDAEVASSNLVASIFYLER